MLGLTSPEGDRGARLAAEPSYGSIDFAARCGNGGNFYVYEGGQGGLFGRYAPEDRIEVVRNLQGRIDYVVNGEVRCTSQQESMLPWGARVTCYPGRTDKFLTVSAVEKHHSILGNYILWHAQPRALGRAAVAHALPAARLRYCRCSPR